MQALEIFRKTVKGMLETLKWNYSDLEKRSGIASSAISVYLSGKKDPSVGTCEKIASAFGVSVSELFSESAPPQPRIERVELPAAVRQAIREEVQELYKSFTPQATLSTGIPGAKPAPDQPALAAVPDPLLAKIQQLDAHNRKKMEAMANVFLKGQRKGKEETG